MDGTYAPQSPDLSSFLSSPSKSQQPYQSTSQSASYAPRSPVIPSFNTQPPPQQQHQLQLQQQHHPQHHSLHPQSYPHATSQQIFSLGVGGVEEFSDYGSSASYMPAIPALPPTHSSFGAPNTTSPYYQSAQRTIKDERSYEYRPSFDGADGDSNYLPSPNMSTTHAPRGRGQVMPSSSSFAAQPPQQNYKSPNPNNIEIKTKFPVARIKRIMQADEEVGKVAQVTPVAVSKALELFMISLVSEAAEKAKEKGGKRVTAQHLKMVVEGDEQFDFLNEIVGKVADVQEGAGGSKRKEKVEGSESEEEKKVKKGRGRRKRGDD